MKFACGCGHKLNVTDTLVGERIKCPRCQKSLTVPDPQALAEAAREKKRNREKRKKQESAAHAASLFGGLASLIGELWESGRPILIRGAGYIFGPLALMIALFVYFKPASLSDEQLAQIHDGMTLKEVEQILGNNHSPYTPPGTQRSHARSPSSQMRRWVNSTWLTGKPTRSLFITFKQGEVASFVWKERQGHSVITHFPGAKGVTSIEETDDGEMIFQTQ